MDNLLDIDKKYLYNLDIMTNSINNSIVIVFTSDELVGFVHYPNFV